MGSDNKAAAARAAVAALDGKVTAASAGSAAPATASIAQPTKTTHTTPAMAHVAVSKIAPEQKAMEHPEGSKYDGPVEPGQTGWLEQQIKTMTGQSSMKLTHHKFKIHNRLVRDEDAKWAEAQRQAKLAAATRA